MKLIAAVLVFAHVVASISMCSTFH